MLVAFYEFSTYNREQRSCVDEKVHAITFMSNKSVKYVVLLIFRFKYYIDKCVNTRTRS